MFSRKLSPYLSVGVSDFSIAEAWIPSLLCQALNSSSISFSSLLLSFFFSSVSLALSSLNLAASLSFPPFVFTSQSSFAVSASSLPISIVSSNSFNSSSASFLALCIAATSSWSSRDAIAFSSCTAVTWPLFGPPSAGVLSFSLLSPLTLRISKSPPLLYMSLRPSLLFPSLCTSAPSLASNFPSSMTIRSRFRFCFAFVQIFSSIECSVISRYM
mmetsp:Transcript_26831/g.39706  ORF Transcript_26831/g.39706 Transcript_26831/m.39706 type:complete len:215 (-) Transcript_26831:640-1284(-)